MNIETQKFHKASQLAICNPTLQTALSRATERFREERNKAFSELKDSEGLREAGRKIREKTIASLDTYLLELEENIKKNGGQVHWAETGEEANNIILDIAHRNNVKPVCRAYGTGRSVIKSKSMTTEEIGINSALEKVGIKVVETDLGEYIIQLAGEKPSHIIIPAIHKTKGGISKLFFEKFGKETYEIREMTDLARQNLREIFFEADLGITGANFLVAETGTLVIVENEGNARYTTTLPKIHIAIVGIEKIVPTLEDLSILLTLLIRSASGQRQTSYVSFINGALEEGREFHLILLDNGRTRILKDPEMRDSLFCIRCGMCLNVCPVYQKIGGHSYGWVYPGPIGSIITSLLLGLDKGNLLPFASTLCDACNEVCPVKISISQILIRLRARIVHKKSCLFERLTFHIWAWVMSHPSIYRKAVKMAYFIEKLIGRKLFLPQWSKYRETPQIAKFTFRDWWALRFEVQGSRLEKHRT